MSTFSCQCQNYRGNLVVSEKEFYFTSSLFRIELEWSNVKRVRLETKQVKGIPTSVLVVVLQHNEAIRLQSTTNSSQKKRGSASRKFFFYGFQDLLGAEELVKHYLELYRTSEKAPEKEGREETDKGSSTAATKRPEKTTEKDDVTSSDTEALKEDSLNLSRLAVPRRPESEPTRVVPPLSFSGRRHTASSITKPKIPVKLLTAAGPSAEEEKRNRLAALFLRVYRHVAVLLVVVMVVLSSRYITRAVRVRDGRYATQSAEKLLRDMDALASATAELESYDSHESLWRYHRGQKRLAELSIVYTGQLEQTAVELMEHYVAIQAKMATLRGHRAARVAHTDHSGSSAPPPPLSMSSEFSIPRTAAATHSAAGTSDAVSGPALVSKAAGASSRSSTAKKDTCAANGACSKHAGSAKKSPAAAKRMSLSRLRADVQRWVRRASAAWAFVARVSRSAQDDDASLFATTNARNSADGGWVVYSEELGNDFHLTEWVASAEDEDRNRCLQLTKELVDTVELTERVFATFASVFLVDRYRQLLSGAERGANWLQPPQALRTLTNGQRSKEKKAFSGAAMARMALLRRFVASLVHNEPLISNQAHRRAAALRIAAALVRYRREEVALLRTRNRGLTDNTTMLWRVLSEMVVAPSTQPLADDPSIPDAATFLRNSLEELRFWQTHESAWREHVLTFFTPEEQAHIRSTFHSDDGESKTLVDLSAQPVALYWRRLPLFRGLLCFEAVPSLERVEETNDLREGDEKYGAEGDAEDEGTEEGAAGATDDDDDDDDDEGEEDAALPSLVSSKATGVLPSLKNKSANGSTHSPTAAKADVPAATSVTPVSASPSAEPSPLESFNLWKDVKLRWMSDLETFRLAFDTQLARRTSRAARSYRLDVEDRSIVADAAEVRRHLFRLLALVNEDYVRYVTPLFVQRVGRFLRSLFPPYTSASSGSDVYVSALQRWGTQDPAVQLATAQVTGLAAGTTQDVSASLLYMILQPPPLLQTSMLSTRKTVAAAIVLVIFAIVLAVLHFMQ